MKTELMLKASEWVTGRRANSAWDALSRTVGRKVVLRPSLNISRRRAEVLMYPAAGESCNEYLADIFLDEITASRGGKRATFYVFEWR